MAAANPLEFPTPPTKQHFWRIRTSIWHRSTMVQLRRHIGPFSVAVATKHLVGLSERQFGQETYTAAFDILVKYARSRGERRAEQRSAEHERLQRARSLKQHDGDYF